MHAPEDVANVVPSAQEGSNDEPMRAPEEVTNVAPAAQEDSKDKGNL